MRRMKEKKAAEFKSPLVGSRAWGLMHWWGNWLYVRGEGRHAHADAGRGTDAVPC